MTRAIIALALLSPFAACKNDDSEAASASPPEPPAIDVAAINAAVPAELGDKIRFARVALEREGVEVAAPEGWASEHMPGHFQPPRDARLGFFTGFSAGSNCDGACSAKDWKATADKVEFAQFTGDGFEVVSDAPIDGGRFLEAKKDGAIYLRYAWWKADGARYFFCRATLEGPAIGARDAFDKACRSMAIRKWD